MCNVGIEVGSSLEMEYAKFTVSFKTSVQLGIVCLLQVHANGFYISFNTTVLPIQVCERSMTYLDIDMGAAAVYGILLWSSTSI